MVEIKEKFKVVATNGDVTLELEDFDNKKVMVDLIFEILSVKYNTTFEHKTLHSIRINEKVGRDTARDAMWLLNTFRYKKNFVRHTKPFKLPNGRTYTGYNFEGFKILFSIEKVEVEKKLKPITKEQLAEMGYILVD